MTFVNWRGSILFTITILLCYSCSAGVPGQTNADPKIGPLGLPYENSVLLGRCGQSISEQLAASTVESNFGLKPDCTLIKDVALHGAPFFELSSKDPYINLSFTPAKGLGSTPQDWTFDSTLASENVYSDSDMPSAFSLSIEKPSDGGPSIKAYLTSVKNEYMSKASKSEPYYVKGSINREIEDHNTGRFSYKYDLTLTPAKVTQANGHGQRILKMRGYLRSK